MPLEEEEVADIMKNQRPKMSCGVDTINNRVVKTCYREITKPMTLVINKSIKERYVPSVYKKLKLSHYSKRVPPMSAVTTDL